MSVEEIIRILKEYPTDMDAVPYRAVSERQFRIALKEAIGILERMVDDGK